MATALTEFYTGVQLHIPSCPSPLMAHYLREAAREFCKETLIWQDWCDNLALAVNDREYTLVPPSNSLVVRAMYGKVKHTASNGIITSATAANPVVCTSAAHGLVEGAKAYVADMDEMTEVNSLTHTVGTVATNTFELSGVDGSGYAPETTGGTWNSVSAYTDLDMRPSTVLDKSDRDWRISGTNYYFYCPDTATVALSWDPAAAVPNGLVIKAALKPTTTATTVPDVLFNDWRMAIEDGAVGRLMLIPGKDWTNEQSAAIYLARFEAKKREAHGDRMAGNTHRATYTAASIGAYT